MEKEVVKIDLGLAKRAKDDLYCVRVPFTLEGKKRQPGTLHRIRTNMEIGIWGGTTNSFTWKIKTKDIGIVFARQQVTNCSPKNIDEKMISLMKSLYKYSKTKKVSSDIEDGIRRAYGVDTNVKVIGSLPKRKIHSVVSDFIKYKLSQIRKGYSF